MPIRDIILEPKLLPSSKFSSTRNINILIRLIVICFLIALILNRKASIIVLMIGVVIIATYILFAGKNEEIPLTNLPTWTPIKEGYSDIGVGTPRSSDFVRGQGRAQLSPFKTDINQISKNKNKYNKLSKDNNNTMAYTTPIVDNYGGMFADTPPGIGYKAHLYDVSKEDLYLEGVGLSNTYDENNRYDDGRCCQMVSMVETPDHVPVKYYTPKLGVNPRTFIPPVIPPRTVEYGYWNYPSTMPSNQEPMQDLSTVPIEDTMIGSPNMSSREKYSELMTKTEDEYAPTMSFYQDPQELNTMPIEDSMLASRISRIDPNDKKYSELMNQTPTCVYTSDDLLKPENRLFLQDVEPNVYSYSTDQTPINSNIGISYTPAMPPRVRDQVCSPLGNYPLFSRIDPQLVRDDVPLGQRIGDPTRGPWSAKYSNLEAGRGSFDESDIYDSRFTGAGDAYRSYSDINLGQVGYYYSDIDAYRAPNFIMRNKVDHVDFTTPDDKTSPYYMRNASLDDVKGQVENSWMEDSTYNREDLQERLMRKRNSELWQLRFAPQSRGANNMYKFSSGGSVARTTSNAGNVRVGI